MHIDDIEGHKNDSDIDLKTEISSLSAWQTHSLGKICVNISAHVQTKQTYEKYDLDIEQRDMGNMNMTYLFAFPYDQLIKLF